jgi:hypothetical protein
VTVRCAERTPRGVAGLHDVYVKQRLSARPTIDGAPRRQRGVRLARRRQRRPLHAHELDRVVRLGDRSATTTATGVP